MAWMLITSKARSPSKGIREPSIILGTRKKGSLSPALKAILSGRATHPVATPVGLLCRDKKLTAPLQ